ncbi:MAG TPA: purine-nucleoside phosphorylase [Kosmotogaceae bacterium]|nr:MAG: Purine nucleoside phosphorylase [Thermotogales bacterium 46_20]HAA85931.1 purine-nucleoside phosphorylase [Kosmotogaceae bacterium]
MQDRIYGHDLPEALASTGADAAIILGSGLGYLTDDFENSVKFDFSEIPGFPESTVEGHSGQLVIGDFAGKCVIGLRGRFHYYEGHTIDDVVAPVRLFAQLGVRKLIITNASGAINCSYSPGDIVGVVDYINFGLKSPLSSSVAEEERSPARVITPIDMTWLERTEAKLREFDIELRRGTYTWVLGPTYETPAEIKAFQKLGGDMVGMSTVPEISTAVSLGMGVLVFSCITNFASGITSEKLSHNEVVSAANKARQRFSQVVRVALEEM